MSEKLRWLNGNAVALLVGIVVCPFFCTYPQVLNNKLYIVYILYNIRAKACDVEVFMVVTVRILVFWGLFICPNGGGTGSDSKYVPTLGHIPEDSNLECRHVSCVL
jgi:hypothetical protein